MPVRSSAVTSHLMENCWLVLDMIRRCNILISEDGAYTFLMNPTSIDFVCLRTDNVDAIFLSVGVYLEHGNATH